MNDEPFVVTVVQENGVGAWTFGPFFSDDEAESFVDANMDEYPFRLEGARVYIRGLIPAEKKWDKPLAGLHA